MEKSHKEVGREDCEEVFAKGLHVFVLGQCLWGCKTHMQSALFVLQHPNRTHFEKGEIEKTKRI